MSTVFTPKGRKSLYTRITIPLVLRPYFKGKLEAWKSLKTTDREEAHCLSTEWKAQGKRLFLTLKQNGQHMTKAEVETLIARWTESALDESEDARAMGGRISDGEREAIYLALSDKFDNVQEALTTNDWRSVEAEAEDLLKSAGLRPLDHDSVEFRRLCRGLLRAKIEVLRIEADRWDGDYKDDYVRRSTVTPSPLESEKANQQAAKQSPLFSVVVEKYLAENPRAARSVKPLRAELLRFMETTGGDRPIATMTKTDGRAYKDNLLHDRKLSQTSCIKHLSNLAVLLKWSEAQGYTPDGFNPVRGLAPSKRQAKKVAGKRRPFTDEELLCVLGSKEFLEQRDTRPERYWLVLLCLFEICRREEAGQLNLSDIGEENGVPFIRITDEGAGQTLKNEGSKRRVPIHSALIRLGFLKYAQHMRTEGHTRLFPQLKRKGGNGYSDPVGKWFGRMVTHCGLNDPELVLHSFRHGGATKLHAAGCPENIVKVLTGHADSDVHGKVYVHREQLPLSLLKEGLERLRYDDVLKAVRVKD